MEKKDLVPLQKICSHYEIELSFINDLNEIGLIEIKTIEQAQFVHQDKIIDIEKMIRIHHELDVNIEGIDVVFNLLQKVDDLQSELIALQNRLNIYEND
jgi:hypothetical protein